MPPIIASLKQISDPKIAFDSVISPSGILFTVDQKSPDIASSSTFTARKHIKRTISEKLGCSSHFLDKYDFLKASAQPGRGNEPIQGGRSTEANKPGRSSLANVPDDIVFQPKLPTGRLDGRYTAPLLPSSGIPYRRRLFWSWSVRTPRGLKESPMSN
ncbi:hypothetical protein EAG_01327 [Camponotus floridanus]|uniref:Uncharacterized protein n=1 Tax=Camponotus floridanus TaxID=104421 RepID=E2ARJ4_CAMFO|nr:hypothetical protein EAG_01327 [Camponotus floridanus]